MAYGTEASLALLSLSGMVLLVSEGLIVYFVTVGQLDSSIHLNGAGSYNHSNYTGKLSFLTPTLPEKLEISLRA